MKQNQLKQKIKDKRPVLGTWNTLASPLVSEVLSRAGFDFLMLDMEHGPFDLASIHQYVSAAQTHDCSIITRVPANQDWMVLQALDQGSQGIQVPHIDDREAAERFLRSAKYFPKGNRGYSPFTKAGGFSNLGAENHSVQSNEAVLTSIIIESLEGLKNLRDIVTLSDLDVVYFGAYVLSQSLGVPGKSRDEKVVDKIREAVQMVNEAGKCAGGFLAHTKEDVNWLLELGMRFITFDVDANLLFRPVRELTHWFEKEHA